LEDVFIPFAEIFPSRIIEPLTVIRKMPPPAPKLLPPPPLPITVGDDAES
jgi:hypothetical protein